MDNVLQDFRFALKMGRRSPSFTVIAVLTLALGIGANTAIFSVVNAVLLKPLPYNRPSELALVWSVFSKMGASRAPAAGVLLREIRENTQSFEDAAGIWVGNATFSGDGEPEQVKMAQVTPNFFSVLGVKPALGQDFNLQAQGPIPAEIIISHGLWQRRYGSDPDLVGKTVRLGGGRGVTVAGILPADFVLSFPPDANVPADIQAYSPYSTNVYSGRKLYFLRVLGRLKPGVTIGQAQAEGVSIAERMRGQYSEYDSEGLQLNIVRLHDDLVSDIRPALVALLIGAGLVLLICCFNVANLLLTRANSRRREMALRAALGASRWRVTRQLLVESFLLCAVAGGLGVGIGWIGLKLLSSLRPESLARAGSIGLDLGILAFVGAVSLGAGMLASLAPVLETRRVNLVETLNEEGRSSSGRVRNRVRRILIVSEVALGFVLLVGAGLMIRTVVQLHRISPGFNPAQTLTFELSPAGGSAVTRANFVSQWQDKLMALPGVQSVGAISHLPLDDYPNWYNSYGPEGFNEDQKANLLADYRAITPGYFRAMETRLLDGRYFDDQDNGSNHKVIIVDELMARQTWPHDSAVGKKVQVNLFTDGGFADDWAEVVGVVEHIKGHSLLRPLRGQIYIPYPQSAREHLSFVVRTSGDPLALVSAIRGEFRAIDKNRAISKFRPMAEYVSKAMAPSTFTAVLAGIFAGLALLLATIGIYGVVSYSASQRTHEIGVRMALGARPVDILKVIIKEGMLLTVVGQAVGLVSAFVLGRYLQSMLFGVNPIDAVTYLVMAAITPAAALVACWMPAQKAALGSPVEALRQQT